MDLLTRRLLLTVLIAVGVLWSAGAARAAEATISYELPSPDPSGISAQTAPGIAGCVAGCTALRLVRGVAVPARRQGLVAFAAPAGTTIVRGSLTLRYRTRQATVSAHLLSRFGGRWIDIRRLRSTGGTRTTVVVGAGASSVAVTLTADAAVPAKAVRSDQENAVAIEGVQLTVRDASAPTVAWAGGDPATGAWQRGTLCGTAAARDVGLGVDRVEYAIGPALATAVAPLGVRLQPRPTAYDAGLCIDTAQLSDGTYGTALTAVDTGADGNRSAAIMSVLRVDNTPPTVAYTAPTDPEARVPALGLTITDGASGVEGVTATIDGLPATLRTAGTALTATPVTPLVDGLHRFAWVATDVAGNVASGAETFGVSDTTPPVIDSAPPQGVVTATTAISVHATDSGSGIATEGWRLAVDGLDVTAACDIDPDGSLSYLPPRGWADGDHSARVTVLDRSGNRTTRAWSFSLPPASPQASPTPPAANQPEPPAIDGPAVAPQQPAEADAASARPAATAQRRPGIVLRASSLHPRAGSQVTLRGRLHGATAARVRLEARVDGRWRLVLRVPVTRGGTFSTPVRLPSPGRYEVRVRAGAAVSGTVRLEAR